MTNWVTIKRFSQLTGYTEKAVRAKIASGVWLIDHVWRKAPDGRILISIGGYEAWAEGQVYAPSESKPFRLISAGKACVIVSDSESSPPPGTFVTLPT